MKDRLWRKGLVIILVFLFVIACITPSICGNIETINKKHGQTNSKTQWPQRNIDWWPMFRHDPNHSGYSTSEAPYTNNTIWNYTTGGTVYSSPAIADGKVYIGSNDDNVYCLDAYNGTEIWNYTTGNGVISSPTVSDGKVYIGSWDKKLYCLNANTGAWIWDYTTINYVLSSPAVADGKVYIGLFLNPYDYYICCLNANTGSKIWDYGTGAVIYSSPAVADGKVYVGSCNGKVYCLNANTGTLIWDYATGACILYSSPAVANGKVYIGSDNGKVYCLNANTGSKIWDYTTGDEVDSSPAVADGKVYVVSHDDKVYCLDADDGTEIWNYTTGGTGFALLPSPAVANGNVYVGSYDRKVYCFGEGNQPLIFGSPNPANGSSNQPLSFTWNILINDTEGDSFNWSINCNNGQTNNSDDEYNGTKSLSISGLDYYAEYTIWVNATDRGSGDWTREWFTFTTKKENNPPVFYNPDPWNGSKEVPITLSSLSVIIEDSEGNSFDWTIETNSNIGSSSGSDEGNGTKVCGVSGLEYGKTYTWYVNATDPDGSGSYNREWFTFTTEEHAPQNFNFVHLTDIHIGAWRAKKIKENFEKVIKNIDSFNPKPAFVIISGDLANKGDCFRSPGWYGDFNEILNTYDMTRYCCPGNHDYYTYIYENGDLDNYYEYVDNRNRYTFRYEDTQFLSLNSGKDAGIIWGGKGSGLTDEDINWVNDTLDGLDGVIDGTDASGLNKIIFMHHPVINGKGKLWKRWDVSVINQNRKEFKDLCDTYDVDIVLTGHTHKNKIYKRNDDGRNVNGQSAPIICTETLYVQTGDCKKNLWYREITINGDEVTVEEAEQVS